MTTKKQLSIAAVILIVAVGFVAFQMRGGDAEAAGGAAGGHNMAAMSAGNGQMNPVVLDREGRERIGITFAIVEYRTLPLFVKTVGTVAYDETRLATVNPKINGWVEKLYVDFTGAPVRAGDPLLEIYSPALVSAQEELILAVRLAKNAAAGRATTNAEQLLESSRRRLEYWDIHEDQIHKIEESGEALKTLTLRAPATGIVVEKNVVEGDRIMPGMTVYRIADLSRVWIDAEVFEKDLALVSEGQGGLVTFEAYPGQTFTSRVTYVYPTVSIQARTGRIRLEMPNPGLNLRPGMYAKITLQVPLPDAAAVVPRSAVIQTGERALVFVEDSEGTLRPREVTPGRTSGRFMQILDGLEAGERVVSSAAFLVDAESNLGTMTGGEGDSMEGMEGMEGMKGMESMPDTGSGDSGHQDHQD
jgi:membrane fusion protein, copper/silver efflux system